MNPNTAWEILGIAPTGDSRAIKRAYAKQLKEDRAHKDTGRFVALRAAYEVTLALAESTIATQDAPSADLQITDTSTQTRFKHEEGDEDQSPLSPAADESILQPHQCPSTEVDSERQPRSRRNAIFRPRVIPDDVSDTRWAARRHRQPADEIPQEEGPAKQKIHPLPRENAEESERKPRQRRKVVFRPQTTPDAEPDGQRLPRTFSRRTNAEHDDDMPPARPVIPTTDDAPDIDQQPRPLRSENLQPAAGDLAFEITISELDRLLNNPDDAELMALGRNIVTHISRADFKQRENFEAWLVPVLAQYRPGRPAFYKLLDVEFGWTAEERNLHQRFPAQAQRMLENIQARHRSPNNFLRGIPSLREIERDSDLEAANGSLLAWLKIILFEPYTRANLETLLATPNAAAQIHAARRRLWRWSLAALPPLGYLSYAMIALLVFCVRFLPHSMEDTAGPVFLDALVKAGLIPLAVWACILVPWHHARKPNGAYQRFWPLLIILFAVILPAGGYALGWVGQHLGSLADQCSPQSIALIATMILFTATTLTWRRRNKLVRAVQSPLWKPALMALLALCVTLLYLLPGTEDLAFGSKAELSALAIMLILSLLRLRYWERAGFVSITLLALFICPSVAIALAGHNPAFVTMQIAVATGFIWLCEAPMRGKDESHSHPVAIRSAYSFTVLGLITALCIRQDAIRHALVCSLLLGAEYVAPLFANAHPADSDNARQSVQNHLGTLVLLGLISVPFSCFILPAIFHTADEGTTMVLLTLLLARLIWMLLHLYHTVRHHRAAA